MEPAEGIQFPTDGSGRRSTTAVSQAVVAEALSTLDGHAADRARAATDWRRTYGAYFAATVTGAVSAGAGAAATLAGAGLAAVHERFVFVRDGAAGSPPAALARPKDARRLHSHTVQGTGERVTQLRVPYRDGVLEGEALRRQLDRWVDAAILEPSAAQALRRVLDQPAWLDLRDLQFVLLGAAAELAPFQPLTQLGAHVLAVDLDRPPIWRRLLATVRGSAGRLTLPLRTALNGRATEDDIVDHAGADLLTMTPEIAAWLLELPGPFCVGAYGYLHGRDHVRLEVAMDALMEALSRRRDDHVLAFLLTPSDVYAVPAEVAQAARDRYAREGARRPWRPGLRKVTGGRLYAPNVAVDLPGAEDGRAYALYDGIVPAQGPNYALAKHIQRWRALAALADGVRVSVNVAPSTATTSVVSRRDFAAAFAGASHYGVEVFAPATSNALMAALLVHDLRAESHPAPDHTAFSAQAVHGGMWRMGVQLRSVIEIAAMRGMLRTTSGDGAA